MPITDTRISRLERALGINEDVAGPFVLISSNAWSAADRDAYAAAQGPVLRGTLAPDVATTRQGTQAATAIICQRTGFPVVSGVIDVPAPEAIVGLPEAEREAWLDEHESRAWKSVGWSPS